MQTFQDSVTLTYWQFNDDVIVTDTAGVYTFKTALDEPLNTPTTLQLYTGTWPVPQTLAQAQSAKIAVINAQYENHQTASFSSSALGAAHSYPSDSVAQTQLGGRITEVHIHLMALVWAAAATKAAGNWCSPGNGWLYQCTVGGLTATLAPTWPTALGATVADGSVTWIAYRQWNGQFLCTDSTGNTASQSHTPDQIWQVGLDAVANIDTLMAHRMNLIGQANAATTVSAVNAIPNW